MKQLSQRVPFVLFALLILLSVVLLQHRYFRQLTGKRPYQDSLYIPSTQFVRLGSLGYNLILADFLWLRAIQAFGGHFLSDRDYRPVFTYFDAITDLDPYFIDAYTFGNTVIGDEGGDIKRGLELIDKGMLKNQRRTYRLGYWGGYVCAWQLNDYAKAKYYYRMALKTPDCPDFVKRLLAYLDLKLGRFFIAFQKYVLAYLEALDNQDKLLQELTRKRLVNVLEDWNLSILRSAAKRFRAERGRDIEALEELVKAGLLSEYRVPTMDSLEQSIARHGKPGQPLAPHSESIVKESLQTRSGIPVSASGSGYTIWVGKDSQDPEFIVSVADLEDALHRYLQVVRARLEFYQEQHERFPEDYREILKEGEDLPEFFGGTWLYEPQSGEFHSSTHPEL